jgi:hypothetical protein
VRASFRRTGVYPQSVAIHRPLHKRDLASEKILSLQSNSSMMVVSRRPHHCKNNTLKSFVFSFWLPHLVNKCGNSLFTGRSVELRHCEVVPSGWTGIGVC